ncbi:hypothetical protein, partial [Escherichia coli]|uniref:hypothetical protein n=1 Tax=Escherichia coli TaxID=562 RepID=UPI0030794E0B
SFFSGGGSISEEHAEYEKVIRRTGGTTISEADDRVQSLLAEGMVLRDEEGPNSKKFKDCLDSILKYMQMYEIVRKRRMPQPRSESTAGA